jgi:hypothetical protein
VPIHGIEPHSLSLFCFVSGEDYKKHMLTYIYICVCVCVCVCVCLYFYLGGVENSCHYTLSPQGPNHRVPISQGLGWTCGASPPGALPKNHHDGILFGERCYVAPIRSFIGLGTPGEGS